ncbi:hypothetical protein OF83DRAFT_837685 [Amylostereum chailletii]|nr:hypothetical protein OF83DRAFT_837685 [Amylostereum chailletii]
MLALAAHIPSPTPDAVAGTTVDFHSLLVINFRREHNERQPINRLPVELLGMIFTILSNDDRPRQSLISAFSLGSSRPNLGWIRVTHVCHYMRNVCLSMKLLWAKVIFTFPSATSVILSRMENTPFPLRWDFSCDMSSLSKNALVVEALQHLPQITDLDLTADDRTFNDIASRMSSYTAESLEKLSLTHSEKISPTTPTCYAFQTTLFAGRTTKLRHLSLRRCTIPWGSPLFQDLTRMEIILDELIPSSKLSSIENLLDILSGAPSLAVLKLVYAIPKSSPSGALPVVALNHLQYIYLVGERSDVMALWTHVILPKGAVANVECVDNISIDECNSLASILTHARKLEELGSSYGISFATNLASAAIQFWVPFEGHTASTIVPVGPFNHDHRPVLTLKFPSPRVVSDLELLALGLFRRVSFCNIQALALNLRGVQLASWVDLLMLFPRLTTLYTHGATFWRISEALNVGYDRSPGCYSRV